MSKSARKGRPRKPGPREPSGKFSRAARKETEGTSPAEVRRLRDAALSGLRDAEWGTEIGRLFLNGRIDAIEYAAAKRYRALCEARQRASGLPSPNPRSMNLAGGHGAPVDPDTEAGREEAERFLDLAAALSDARSAIWGAGYLPWWTVVETVEKDHPCEGLEGCRWLSKGLSALAKHWGMGS